MKKWVEESFLQSLVGGLLWTMESPNGDGRLEESWLHDMLSVTWAHLEPARRVRAEQADKKAVIHLCVAMRKATKSEVAQQLAAELQEEMLADVHKQYVPK
jgi:hypothetical protein